MVTGDGGAFNTAITNLAKFSVGSALFTGLRGALFWISGARVVSRLRQQLFRNLLRQDIPFFDKHDTGELTSRTGDAALLALSGAMLLGSAPFVAAATPWWCVTLAALCVSLSSALPKHLLRQRFFFGG